MNGNCKGFFCGFRLTLKAGTDIIEKKVTIQLYLYYLL